jgi:O-antigen/teichoic acid export membrane protein
VAKKEFIVLKKAHTQFEFLIYAITAFLYSCALILINPFISVYTQGIADINYVYPIYGVLLVIWGILHNVRIPYTALVNASGLYKETSKVNILSVVLLVVLSLILVQFLGIIGVLIALIIAAFYRGVDLILVVKPLVVCESTRTTFMRILRMYSVVVVTSLPFLLWIPLTASNLYEWFIEAIGVAGWCGAVTILFNFLFERKVFFDTVHRIEGLMDYRHQ